MNTMQSHFSVRGTPGQEKPFGRGAKLGRGAQFP
jgi:hypothetical protein